jgi:dTMP kinase
VALVVEPALAAGEWVVSDRYAGSTVAYQGYGLGLPVTELVQLSTWASGGLVADLSVLVDVSVEVAAARIAGSPGGTDRLERLGAEFAARVRQGFLAQAAGDPEHWLVVDGSRSVEEITTHIVDEVHERFGEAPGNAGDGGSGGGAVR